MIDLFNDWRDDEKLVRIRQNIIAIAVQNQRTMADKEETCPRHDCKTVYSGMMGLWPCPQCAREERGRQTKPRETSLPYKDAPEPPELTVEIEELDEIDRWIKG